MNTRLYFGDCIEVMQDIQDKSIDLILCDIPYGTTSNQWDIVIPFDKLWEQYKRISKKGAAIVLFGKGIFTARLILSNEKWYKYSLVWKKSKCGSPLLANYRPMQKHEDIVVFSSGGGKHTVYNPQMTVGEPYSRTGVRVKTNNHRYGLKTVTTSNSGTRFPTSILDFPMKWRRQDQIHPTQKPVELIEYLISTYSNIGDLVLDNCMGSGTTGVACKYLDRNFIGIENNQEYFNMAEKRINTIALQSRIDCLCNYPPA